jgi:hypothetical protein
VCLEPAQGVWQCRCVSLQDSSPLLLFSITRAEFSLAF